MIAFTTRLSEIGTLNNPIAQHARNIWFTSGSNCRDEDHAHLEVALLVGLDLGEWPVAPRTSGYEISSRSSG